MEVKVFSQISEIDEAQWNELASGQFPFESWGHFKALEDSKCVGEGTGWHPLYLTLYEGNELVGAIYFFVKTHSYGEYIFDWEWGHWAEQLGVSYYPKIISAVPFTPASGAKLLVKKDCDYSSVASSLLKAVKETIKPMKVSSIHFLFIPLEELDLFESHGFEVRHTYQFHWTNRGYSSFNEFLGQLKVKKRKEIKRERARLSEFEFIKSSGTGLEKNFGRKFSKKFYQFYLKTISKKGSYAYLNEQYFEEVFQNLSSSVHVFGAQKNEELVAASLCYHAGDKLYGRYWGGTGEYDMLHFELCYYQPIEYAIQNKIKIFEAGAQGPHKINRGFLPEITYSAHWIRDEVLARPVSQFVDIEKKHLKQAIMDFSQNTPYKSEC